MSLEEFFGVTTRTLQRWQKAGADLTDPVALAAFVRGLSRPSESVSRRLAAGNLADALRGILDAEAPPPFAAKVLSELKTALTGVWVARLLLEEDPEFVSRFGSGDITQACSEFGVSGKKELATLLLAVREILEEGLAELEKGF